MEQALAVAVVAAAIATLALWWRSGTKPTLHVVVAQGPSGRWRWLAYDANSDKYRCGGPPRGFDSQGEATMDARSVLRGDLAFSGTSRSDIATGASLAVLVVLALFGTAEARGYLPFDGAGESITVTAPFPGMDIQHPRAQETVWVQSDAGADTPRDVPIVSPGVTRVDQQALTREPPLGTTQGRGFDSGEFIRPRVTVEYPPNGIAVAGQIARLLYEPCPYRGQPLMATARYDWEVHAAPGDADPVLRSPESSCLTEWFFRSTGTHTVYVEETVYRGDNTWDLPRRSEPQLIHVEGGKNWFQRNPKTATVLSSLVVAGVGAYYYCKGGFRC